jgi:hypothetical protein
LIVRVSPYNDGTPARTQISNIQSFTVTLRQTPTVGNTLIACVGLCPIGNGATVSSIVQGGNGSNWSRIVRNGGTGTTETEIWAYTITSGATTQVTVNLDRVNPYYSVVDICEYSGLLNITADQTSNATGNSNLTDTGQTGQTTQNGELWIGATTYSSGTYGQTNPTKGFTKLDGALYQSVSLAYLEFISHNRAIANSGTQNSGWAAWSGCIATFKAAGSTSTYDNITVHDIIQVDSPNNGWITLYGVDYGMGAPILEVSQSLLARNDMLTYGSITTMSDPSKGYGGGALNVGHGWEATWDNPRVNLSDSGYSTLYITAGSNYDQNNNYTGPIMGNMKLSNLYWSSGAYLTDNQGGSIELGNSTAASSTPFIDFHFGRSTTEDYNVRLINSSDCILYFGTRTSTGGILPTVDNQYVLGSPTNRWSLIRGVTITSGDLKFENDWVFTEDGDNLVLKRPDGTIAQRWIR